MEHSKFNFNLLSFFFVLNVSISCVINPDNLNLDTTNSDIKNEAIEPKPIKDNPTEYKNIESAISNIANNSKCSSYSWLNRGRAPAAYIRRMAITFARSYCRLNNSKYNDEILRSLYTLGYWSRYAYVFRKILQRKCYFFNKL